MQEATKPLGLPNKAPIKEESGNYERLTIPFDADALSDAQIDALIIRIDARRTAVKPVARRQWLYHPTKEPMIVEGAASIMGHLSNGWFDSPDKVKAVG